MIIILISVGNRVRRGQGVQPVETRWAASVCPEFGGCFALCLVRGFGCGVFPLHGRCGGIVGLGDGGFVPGAGVCSDGGEGPGL